MQPDEWFVLSDEDKLRHFHEWIKNGVVKRKSDIIKSKGGMIVQDIKVRHKPGDSRSARKRKTKTHTKTPSSQRKDTRIGDFDFVLIGSFTIYE